MLPDTANDVFSTGRMPFDSDLPGTDFLSVG